jgi:Holliday junction DNA helicase RuvA
VISFLRGALAFRDVHGVIIDVNGVGFSVGMSTQSIASLGNIGDMVTVFTTMQVRDADLSLYGFSSEEERLVFDKLITVSGVGPKVALSALSTFPASILVNIISSDDTARIASVPGIGKKTAQRIVLELKTAFGSTDDLALAAGNASASEGHAQATDALLGMGFTATEVSLALKGYDGDSTNTGAFVRYALKRLGTS